MYCSTSNCKSVRISDSRGSIGRSWGGFSSAGITNSLACQAFGTIAPCCTRVGKLLNYVRCWSDRTKHGQCGTFVRHLEAINSTFSLSSQSQQRRVSASANNPLRSASSITPVPNISQYLRQQEERIQEAEPVPCNTCNGLGQVICPGCGGKCRLARGGYAKRNPVDLSRLVGGKWTAMQETLGWRHFRVLELRKQVPGTCFVKLAASCDPAAQIWVNSLVLKDRSVWASGWLQMSQLAAEAEGQLSGAPCRMCSAAGIVSCRACNGMGSMPTTGGR